MSDQVQPTTEATAPTGGSLISEAVTQPASPEPTREVKPLTDTTAQPDPAKPVEAQQQEGNKPEAQKSVPFEKMDSLTLPEGFKLNTAASEQVAGLFTKHALTQEAAQDFVNFYAGEQERQQEATNQKWNEVAEGWRKESMALPNFQKEQHFIGKVKDQLDPAIREEFVKFMNDTRFGEHPTMVKVLISLGKLFSEDRLVEGRGGADQRSPAEIMYGK